MLLSTKKKESTKGKRNIFSVFSAYINSSCYMKAIKAMKPYISHPVFANSLESLQLLDVVIHPESPDACDTKD